jgi:hypothetical protein
VCCSRCAKVADTIFCKHGLADILGYFPSARAGAGDGDDIAPDLAKRKLNHQLAA